MWSKVVLCFVSLYLILSFDVAHSRESNKHDFISSELLRIESLRISDHEAFAKGLKKLATDRPLMTDFQSCHYSFLEVYQMAFMGLYQQSIDEAILLKQDCEAIGLLIRIEALLANVYALSGEYNKAILAIDRTIANITNTEDIQAKTIAYSAASMVYSLLNQKELAVKYGEILKALEPTTENDCRLKYIKSFYQVNSIYNEIEYDEIDYFDNSCLDSKNLLFAQSILINSINRKLSNETVNQKMLDELGQLMAQVRPEISIGPYKNIQAQFFAIEAKFALIQGDMDKAKKFGLEAMALNEGLGITGQLKMALDVLEKVALSEGNFAEAHQYLHERNQAEMSLYDQSQAKQMAFMTVKHTNQSKTIEIEQLNQQKSVLELEKKLAKQEANNQKLLIMLILTILALLLMWLMRIKKRHDYFKNVSEVDHLTKVLTRKAFEEQAPELIQRMAGREQQVHMVIMDLDHFKLVNDNHGHLVGDWTLKHVVYACKELIEKDMMIARLGGEEFCMVIPNMNFNEMSAKVESLRSAVEELNCSESGADFKVTASFGVSSSIISGYNMNVLLTHADVALFDAKKQGRNQVVFYSPSDI